MHPKLSICGFLALIHCLSLSTGSREQDTLLSRSGEFNAGGNPAMDYHPIQGGVQILLVASCLRNWDKLRPDGPLGSHADFIFTVLAREWLASIKCLFFFIFLNNEESYPSGNFHEILREQGGAHTLSVMACIVLYLQ